MKRFSRKIASCLIWIGLIGCIGETAVSPIPSSIPPTTAPIITITVETHDFASLPPTETAVLPPTPTTPTIAATVETQDIASPSATAAPTIPPTRIIEGLIGPDTFPENVNPLTGLVVNNPAKLDRRPFAIKISNAPPSVRPQAGLNDADLVFEHLAEGGFTRFTAVFYTNDVETVGSIRSARLIDLEIPQMYDAAFGYSGSAGLVRERFRDSSFFERIVSPDFAHGGYFRVEDPAKAVEHTLFTNTYNLHFILNERGQDTPPTFVTNMAFRDEPITVGEPATRLELWYEATNATWFYSNGRYLRWTDGIEHIDANTNQQLNFRNIIIIAAHHQETDILEDTAGAGNYSIEIQIWGEGPVSIFRDGQRFDGRWRRDHPSHMITFYDLEGNILPLAPGNTFFQIVPLGFDRLT
ncbi:MAG: DUF3048 domain-containing protein, partial [Chloroflexi bacterium]|nr:DUF3048 domain-containing protein [Chloroflexota bacterium]